MIESSIKGVCVSAVSEGQQGGAHGGAGRHGYSSRGDGASTVDVQLSQCHVAPSGIIKDNACRVCIQIVGDEPIAGQWLATDQPVRPDPRAAGGEE